MEEGKAAAYYDELSRKGEGAARYKQGLGFSSSSSSSDLKRPNPTAASSFLGGFVRASSPGRATEFQRQAQLETIQNKLKKKPLPPPEFSHSGGDADADRRYRRRSRSRSRSRERYRDRRRSRSKERDRSTSRHHSAGRRREDEDEKYRSGRRRRSRSRSGSEERERSRQGRHGHSREDYLSSGADRSRSDAGREDGMKRKGRNGSADYSQLIEGYSQMTPAERVKAKMKLQLSQAASKDTAKGMTAGWERFDFNKDAPLDDDEIEVAEDDESLVKDIGQSFRYSAVEAKREEEIKAAHDQAMFGVSTVSPTVPEKEVTEDTQEKTEEKDHGHETLISEKALAIQGSWRDRMHRPKQGQGD